VVQECLSDDEAKPMSTLTLTERLYALRDRVSKAKDALGHGSESRKSGEGNPYPKGSMAYWHHEQTAARQWMEAESKRRGIPQTPPQQLARAKEFAAHPHAPSRRIKGESGRRVRSRR
jgi:hypothetical protein